LRFLEDGTLLTGSFDGYLERWRSSDGRRIAVVATHDGPVADIAVTERGDRAVTSSLTTGTIQEWTTEGLRLLAELPGGPFALTATAFIANGRTAIALFDNGSGISWPVTLADWQRRACRVAGRNLTSGEWHEFLPGHSYQRTCP